MNSLGSNERSPLSFVEECSGLKRGLAAGTGPVDALIRKAQAIAATRQTSVSTRKKNSGVVMAGGYVAGSYSRGTILESGDSPPRGILSDFFDSKGEPKIEDQARDRSPRPFVTCCNFVPSYPKIGDKNIGAAIAPGKASARPIRRSCHPQRTSGVNSDGSELAKSDFRREADFRLS
jgi:hypothetical protein